MPDAKDTSFHMKSIVAEDALTRCPSCGYTQGFHVGFLRQQDGSALPLVLICPSCGERFDIARSM